MIEIYDSVKDLLGKPFKWRGRSSEGYDCYGLVIEIYKRRGIQVLDWESPESMDDATFLNIWAAEMASSAWVKVEKPRGGIGVALTAAGNTPHCGYMIDEHKFIHCSNLTKVVCIESIYAPRWANRIRGFYDCVKRD